ncbi:molybdopterin-guanine dinucleotide biosynthesis protein MobA [Aeromicrobium phragmitis]|uniref:Molybdopterin-guanine dinucleotide biosynthesis protein MobA n=1 Tax=Aeromicrobium phragmitis TaxID=2478914 RepID=A0A3L8PIH7_9ACTN|nr:DUF6457 domain-containing protein [Aeromicrobium phragmitis]RLV54940.1 molybdopterin-guanine dinucleotide biosynthesis protein MobA [Aeromicrobium phragmitis]
MATDDVLTEWTEHLATRFGLDPRLVPVEEVLDMAADVAHGVVRPAAPLSAFVAGLVAGRSGGTPQDIADAVAAVVREVDAWTPS